MKHIDLKALKTSLKNYYCYFKADNILSISEDKSVLPFVSVICDKNYPDYLLLSLAVDYNNPEKAVEITLLASQIKAVGLTEPFYISQNGSTYVGKEAQQRWDLEVNIPLSEMEPVTDSIH